MQDIELFTDATAAVVTALQKKGFIDKVPTKVERNPFIHKVDKQTSNLELTDEQQAAFEEISSNLNTANEYLVFGVTGSGKTEIYLQLIGLHERKIDMVVNIPKDLTPRELTNGYKIRRSAIDLNIPLITNSRLASAFIHAFCTLSLDDIDIKSWAEYM